MEINLLVLNVGNSRLALGVFSAGTLEHVVRLGHDDQESVRDAIALAWKKVSSGSSSAVVGASVNPAATGALDQLVYEITGQGVQWVGKDIELPLNVLTEAPADTGVDRLMNIAAAYAQMEHACVVVDAGTAITIDVCNDNGDFLGGAISPGVEMMLDALHDKTAKLPRVKFDVPTGDFGISTEGAIRQGIYHGVRGMVKELVENYATALGRWPEVIATGGNAHALFAGWELIHAIAPDLTLYGIALAYTNHQLRHAELGG